MPYNKWKNSHLFGRSEKLFGRLPGLVACSYAIGSIIWIQFSDRFLVTMAGDYAEYQAFQTYKGWFFVTVSALLIYGVLKNAWNGMQAAYQSALESEQRLELALASAQGGVWEIDLANGDQKIAYVSSELTTRLGFDAGHQLTMQEFRARRHPEDLRQSEIRLIETARSRGAKPYDVRYRVFGGDGRIRWVHSMGNVVPGSGRQHDRLLGVALDITDQMEASERIKRLLRFDSATGLPKQNKFLDDIDDRLAALKSGETIAIVQVRFVDLDHLMGEDETITDARIVQMIAERLRGADNVLTARISDDVFAFATEPAKGTAGTQHGVREVMDALLQPYGLQHGAIRLRVQTGAIVTCSDAQPSITLLRNAGQALELADKSPDIDVSWFNAEISDEFRQRNDRIRDLDHAVERGEIESHFQPLIDIRTGRTAGFEALARWHRPAEGMVRPDEFIALAEEYGQINMIGEEILRQACRTAAEWGDGGPFVSVNVSPIQLQDPTFPSMVARVLAETGLSGQRLELEITENALIKDLDAVSWRLECLRELGISIAIDDFGTGYSSLSLLTKVPFSRLKIDQSFIRDFGRTRESTIIVDTMIGIAERLGLMITAEGIENAGIAALLAGRSAMLGQGYLFSKPVPAAETTDMVSRYWTATWMACPSVLEFGSNPVPVQQLAS